MWPTVNQGVSPRLRIQLFEDQGPLPTRGELLCPEQIKDCPRLPLVASPWSFHSPTLGTELGKRQEIDSM